MKVVNKKDNSPNVIQLSLNPGQKQGPEGYALQITVKPARVLIVGGTLGGLHNGIQTFLSLMATGSTLPVMRVVDRPRFEYRGIQLDVARNFFNKSTVLKLLEIMAMYKLNKLQLNMADEEGWRIEVPGIPELTDVSIKNKRLLQYEITGANIYRAWCSETNWCKYQAYRTWSSISN